MTDTRTISICGVPYEISIVDNCVLFSNKSGFCGVTGRFVWIYKSHLWYLATSEATFGDVAGVHLVKMHKTLCELIGADHEEFPMTFKDTRGTANA